MRENVEDLCARIEHMETPSVAKCLKLMSKKGCERIVRVAFEVAVSEGRRSVRSRASTSWSGDPRQNTYC